MKLLLGASMETQPLFGKGFCFRVFFSANFRYGLENTFDEKIKDPSDGKFRYRIDSLGTTYVFYQLYEKRQKNT